MRLLPRIQIVLLLLVNAGRQRKANKNIRLEFRCKAMKTKNIAMGGQSAKLIKEIALLEN